MKGGPPLALPPKTTHKQNMKQPRLLVSACLCGAICRYDGKAAGMPLLAPYMASGLVLPFCPETSGGLPVPRDPCEICQNPKDCSKRRVLSKTGKDCTAEFERGAALALAAAHAHGIATALLKDKSPSCGSRFVYDGSFGGQLVEGAGFTAALLKKNGLAVFGEAELEEALRHAGVWAG
jgi:Uncharacterized conserved protein